MEENEEMKTLIENFRKCSFPSLDEFNASQENERNDAIMKGSNNPLITEVEGDEIRHERKFTPDDQFTISSTKRNRIFAVKSTMPEKNNNLKAMSMDDLKFIRDTSLNNDVDDDNAVSTTISEVSCLLRKPGSEPKYMIEDLTPAEEATSHISEISLSKDTEDITEVSSINNVPPSTENKNIMFISKTDVKDFLQELNQDNSKNTDILIREMKASNTNLATRFQDAVTSAFREVAISLNEMKQPKVGSRREAGLPGCVGNLYRQIMKDNREMKQMIGDLIHCSDNEKFRLKRCTKIPPDEEMGNLTGPAEEDVSVDRRNTNMRQRLKDDVADNSDVSETQCGYECEVEANVQTFKATNEDHVTEKCTVSIGSGRETNNGRIREAPEGGQDDDWKNDLDKIKTMHKNDFCMM